MPTYYEPGTRKGNRTWVVRGYVDGRQYEIVTGASTESEASRFWKAFTRELRGERLAGKSRIYFLSAGRQAIKIGSTRNIRKRLEALRSGNYEDLTLLGTIPGNVELERDLQIKFNHLHIRGEWYKYSSELLQFIRTVTSDEPFAR